LIWEVDSQKLQTEESEGNLRRGENVPETKTKTERKRSARGCRRRREDFERKIGSLPVSLWSNWSREYPNPNLSREGHELMLVGLGTGTKRGGR
jgi:hypothetical protein